MISGASEEELTEAIGRADVLLEFMPKIKQLQQENKQLKEAINKVIEYIEKEYYSKNTFDIDNIGMTTNKLLQVRNILKEVSE